MIYTLFYYFSDSKSFTLATEKRPIAPSAKEGKPAVIAPNGKKTDKIKQLNTTPKQAKKVPVKDVVVKAGSGVEKDPKIASAITKKKAGPKKKILAKTGVQKIIFQIRFTTVPGQDLYLMGDHSLFGNNEVEKAIPLQYFNEDYWHLSVEIPASAIIDQDITYHYILKNADGTLNYDWGNDKTFNLAKIHSEELLMVDAWNYAGYFENSFYTEPFTQVLLKQNRTIVKTVSHKKGTHILKVKSPLLSKEQTLCMLGSGDKLGEWDTSNPLLMSREEGSDFFALSLDLSKESFPIAYKYGVYDTAKNAFVRFEDGNNRVLHDAGKANRETVINDGFAVLPNNTWKGAGTAIPVFSLRTQQSFGTGEFTDLKLLVDWAVKTGLKMVQILPINDTTATHSWIDSYPYAAISAFALHPLYLNISKIFDSVPARKRLQKLEAERLRLNALSAVDYEAVTKIKQEYAVFAFKENGTTVLASEDFKAFFEQNKHWLVPYAAFCYLRDQYGTVDFSKWPAYKQYSATDIAKLADPSSAAYHEIALHYFIQYHLHLQLKEATAYAHANGIIVKGDIAIGVYRHGADAWQNPELYHLNFQAGAPPDDFAVTGQNWGFPTYNWQRMREDGFSWWKQRFEQMSYYFDAFRIDHILGFFRIWSIPMDAVEGIMGHFVPAIPVHLNEFNSNHIWFDHFRYTQPYITENVLWQVFGYDNELVKSLFLKHTGDGNYILKPEYKTQRLVEKHFASLEQDTQHEKIRQGLYTLISNVILFEAENGDGQHFHFRIGMENTSSFRSLEYGTQQQLRELYVNYFFRRQDDFWMKEALQKLPALKRVTNMLVCGEDLGMVPDCVPEVMKQLGLLSLEIQRMPKDVKTEFFHPNDAPYLSVVTPSTHDMSTIRGWWEEDRARIQRFYNNQLGQWGDAPLYCEAWINKAIVLQHLYSPAMWSVFQLQDLLGISETLRREDPNEERINIPANPKHYWQYRMHLNLEQLLEADDFNEELKGFVTASGR